MTTQKFRTPPWEDPNLNDIDEEFITAIEESGFFNRGTDAPLGSSVYPNPAEGNDSTSGQSTQATEPTKTGGTEAPNTTSTDTDDQAPVATKGAGASDAGSSDAVEQQSPPTAAPASDDSNTAPTEPSIKFQVAGQDV